MNERPTGFTQQARVLKPGQILVKEGDSAKVVFRVDSGEVELSREGRVLGRRGMGAFLGASAALEPEDDDVPTTHWFSITGVATPATVLSEYLAHDLRHAVSAYPEVVDELLRGLDEEALWLEGAVLESTADQKMRMVRLRGFLRARAERSRRLLDKLMTG